jgi:hypothetical protein
VRRMMAKAVLAEPQLTPMEWRVLSVAGTVFMGSFGQLSDRTYVARLAQFVYGLEEREALQRWQVKKVAEALVSLRGRGILDYEDRLGAGQRRMSLIPAEKAPHDGGLTERVDRFLAHFFGEGSLKKAPRAVSKGPSSRSKRPLVEGASPGVTDIDTAKGASRKGRTPSETRCNCGECDSGLLLDAEGAVIGTCPRWVS